MKYILVAEDEKPPKEFFPLWEVLVLILVVCLYFYLFFPKNLLQKTLSFNEPSPAILNYLQGFSRVYPDNMNLQLRILDQQISLGLINEARNHQARLRKQNPGPFVLNQLRWADFLIIRHQVYNSKPNTAEHISYLRQLRQITASLAHTNLNPEQLKLVADASLTVGQVKPAFEIYKQLSDRHALMTVEDFFKAGIIAGQSNVPIESAKFYREAYLRATTKEDKAKFALNVIEALWAGNKVQEAFDFSQHLPDDMFSDRETLTYFSRLALAVNRPEIAEKYAIRALLAKPKVEKKGFFNLR